MATVKQSGKHAFFDLETWHIHQSWISAADDSGVLHVPGTTAGGFH